MFLSNHFGPRYHLSSILKVLMLLALPASVQLSTASSLAADNLVIATVDINQILNASGDARDQKKRLDSKSGELRKSLEKKRNALQEKEKSLKEKGDKASESEIVKFQQEAKDFARQVKDAEEDLQLEFRKANDKLTMDALKAVEDYANRNNIDLVLEKSEAGRSVVLFRAATIDITEEVIKGMK